MVVSKDVTFDEKGVWDWSGEEKNPLVVLVVGESNLDEDQEVQSTLVETSTRPQRQRRLPTHLEDYVVGNFGTSFNGDTNDAVYYALFAYCDPLSYEEAVNDDCQVQAMDEEIQAYCP